MNIVKFLQDHQFSRNVVFRLGNNRAELFVSKFITHLPINSSILDIGAGTCNIADVLAKKGYTTTSLDVENLSFNTAYVPTLYDGKTIPFASKSYDTALILTVLHHISEPDDLIREASRVAKQIVIIEDIYTSEIHRYATYFVDSVLNAEFKGHPHTNRTDEQWRETFKKMNLTLTASYAFHSFGIMQHRCYIVKPEST